MVLSAVIVIYTPLKEYFTSLDQFSMHDPSCIEIVPEMLIPPIIRIIIIIFCIIKLLVCYDAKCTFQLQKRSTKLPLN